MKVRGGSAKSLPVYSTAQLFSYRICVLLICVDTRDKYVLDELPLGCRLHGDALHAEGAAVLSRLRPVERAVRVGDPREVVLKVRIGVVNLVKEFR